MILNTKYYFWKNGLSSKMCDDIIKLGLSKKSKKATVRRTNNKTQKTTNKYRDSQVVFLDDLWIYNAIQPFIYEANKNANWNFQWDWTESTQFTIYGPNQHYNWHVDTSLPYNEPKNINVHGKIRKISMSICLSDPKNFKGGELEFNYREHKDITKCKPHKVKEINNKGGVVVFPSDTWHRVTPVTKGTRYSLVAWSLGQPFK
jgi:PKHD-type hydroxylase